MTTVDYFQIAVTNARAQAKRIARDFEPAVKVITTAIGPDNCTMVPCGEATFPRCQADVFDNGVLTITSRDDDAIIREFQPGQWVEAVVYDRNDQIDYCLYTKDQR